MRKLWRTCRRSSSELAVLVLYMTGIAFAGINFSQRIGENRSSEFVFVFENGKEESLPSAKVSLRQIRHDFVFGGALFTPLFDLRDKGEEKLQALDRANEMFNLVVDGNGFKWKNIEPQKGNIDPGFNRNEAITRWASEHNKDLRYHCLFWSSPQQNPDWLKKLPKEMFHSALLNRIAYVRDRTGEHIRSLDVINEMLYFNFYQERLGQSIIKELYVESKKAFPGARLYLNEFPPQKEKSLKSFQNYVELIRKLRKEGVPFDGIGLQAHFDAASLMAGKMSTDEFCSAMDTIINNLSTASGLPVLISEYDYNSSNEDDRADFLKKFYTMAFSNTHVEGIIAWEWIDFGNKTFLVDRKGRYSKAGNAYCDLVLRDWRTSKTLVTDKRGRATAKCFFGEYEITVDAGKGNRTKTISLHRASPRLIHIRMD